MFVLTRYVIEELFKFTDKVTTYIYTRLPYSTDVLYNMSCDV